MSILSTDRSEGDDVGARERDSEGADSDATGGGAIAAAHVDQAAQPGDTIHRKIAFLDDTHYTLSAAHDRQPRLLISMHVDVHVWNEERHEDSHDLIEFAVSILPSDARK